MYGIREPDGSFSAYKDNKNNYNAKFFPISGNRVSEQDRAYSGLLAVRRKPLQKYTLVF